MSTPGHVLLAAALASLAAAGCSGGGAGTPDAAPVNPYSCEPGEGSGEAFDVTMGIDVNGEFTAVAEGDMVPIVQGNQGLFMIPLELRSSQLVDLMPTPADSVCLDCNTVLGATDGFAGLEQRGFVGFDAIGGGSYSGYSTLILAGGEDLATALDGSQLSLSVSCNGHGFAGEVSQTVQLVFEQP